MDIICRLQPNGIGISSSIYLKVEFGCSNPSAEMILALTEVLQCGCDEFFAE